MGSSTSAVNIAWNHTVSKVPSIAVVMTITYIYYMYMESFLIPLMQAQNKIMVPDHFSLNSSDIFSHFRWNRSWVYFIILHYLAFWFLVSLIRVVATCPGFVPADWDKTMRDLVAREYVDEQKLTSTGPFTNLVTIKSVEKFEILSEAVMNFMKKKNYRFCRICKNFKPERTHHCRQTGRCVLKMDHYCNWISTCIGLRNYKFFLTFILYTSRPILM